jgi:hypothetical protein
MHHSLNHKQPIRFLLVIIIRIYTQTVTIIICKCRNWIKYIFYSVDFIFFIYILRIFYDFFTKNSYLLKNIQFLIIKNFIFIILAFNDFFIFLLNIFASEISFIFLNFAVTLRWRLVIFLFFLFISFSFSTTIDASRAYCRILTFNRRRFFF